MKRIYTGFFILIAAVALAGTVQYGATLIGLGIGNHNLVTVDSSGNVSTSGNLSAADISGSHISTVGAIEASGTISTDGSVQCNDLDVANGIEASGTSFLDDVGINGTLGVIGDIGVGGNASASGYIHSDTGLTTSGSLVLDGTVDGVDVAARDGVLTAHLASATNPHGVTLFQSEVIVGTSTDLAGYVSQTNGEAFIENGGLSIASGPLVAGSFHLLFDDNNDDGTADIMSIVAGNLNGLAKPLTFVVGNASGRLERMRITNAGYVGISTSTPQTGLHNSGFTMLGDSSPKIKMKKLTGTTGGTEGNATATAHLLAINKIISATCLVNYSYPPSLTDVTPGYQYDFYLDVTNAYVKLHDTNSENILSAPYTILITYEE